MADHVNISHPDRQLDWLSRAVAYDKLEAELKVTEAARRDLARDLDAIFTRVARGDDVELHYPDGSVIVVRAVKADG